MRNQPLGLGVQGECYNYRRLDYYQYSAIGFLVNSSVYIMHIQHPVVLLRAPML